MQEIQVRSLGQENPSRKKWQPILVFWLGKSHGQRSLAGYSAWGCKRVGHDLATKTVVRMLRIYLCIYRCIYITTYLSHLLFFSIHLYDTLVVSVSFKLCSFFNFFCKLFYKQNTDLQVFFFLQKKWSVYKRRLAVRGGPALWEPQGPRSGPW